MASGNHYINNKEFEQLIIKYQADPDTYGNELFGMYDLLINNIMDSFGFDVDRDDAKKISEYVDLIENTTPVLEK